MDGLDEARRTVDDLVVLYGPSHHAVHWARLVARDGAKLLRKAI